jgi:hypothetical protein
MIELHNFLFRWQMFYSFFLGIYAVVLAARSRGLSGNFWGAVAIYPLLNIAVLALGIYFWLNGYTIASDDRIIIYFLYMLFLIVIMPGLFSILRGRDDAKVTWYFVALAIFNASVSFSMAGRGLSTWILPS